ncbi:MAG: ABC transporter permease [Verrucomicrobiales bacterium]|nr:ABC transporter permease [Verrucomicrobiales bacterium]
MNDLKFAFRQVLKNPGFTALAVLTLALGIGATTTVFSLIQGVLLTPPPYRDPGRLVLIQSTRTDGQRSTRGWPAAQWLEWQKESRTLDSLAAFGWTFNFLVLPEGSESIEGMRVTPEYFQVLGLHLALGRPFDDSDLKPDNATTVILGHDLWQRRFHGDPHIVGQTIQISRSPHRHTVVGVMPPAVRFLPTPNVAQEPNYNVDAKVDYWLPTRPPGNLKAPAAYVVARLRPGVSPAEAQAEIASMTERQARGEPEFQGFAARLQPLATEMNREGRRLLMPVTGAVALVFLIACGNAAGLLLARGLQRQHEYALRSALGAGSLQICRPILCESVLLALLGGVLGLLLAVVSLDALRWIAGASIPRLDAVRLGWPVFVFCLGAALVAGLAAGLLPAWRALRRHPSKELKAGGRTASAGRTERRLLGGVAAVQIALTLALLVGASLLIQTVRSLAQVRPGYDTQSVLTLSVTTVGTNWLGFHSTALERVAQLPGVQAAAFAWGVPLTGNKWESTFEVDGQAAPALDKDRPVLPLRSVTPDYFTALGLRLIEGRPFRTSDDDAASRVAIVNQAAADRYFPGGSALGRRLRFPGNRTNLVEIVGILANTRTDTLTEAAAPEIYLPFWQSGAFSKHLVLRTQSDPRALATTVQKELRALDPTVAVENIRTLEQIRDESVASRTFAMNLLGGFALAACVLAAVGIYGVLSMAAGSRRCEMAIRMAVGAQRLDILRLLLMEGLRLAGLGVGLGLAVSLILSTGLKTYLFGVQPADPLTLATMVAVILGITLVTCWIPARRAARVEPLIALRNEG